MMSKHASALESGSRASSLSWMMRTGWRRASTTSRGSCCRAVTRMPLELALLLGLLHQVNREWWFVTRVLCVRATEQTNQQIKHRGN